MLGFTFLPMLLASCSSGALRLAMTAPARGAVRHTRHRLDERTWPRATPGNTGCPLEETPLKRVGSATRHAPKVNRQSKRQIIQNK